MNYGMRFMTLYRRQGSRPFPWKRNAKVGSQETPGVIDKLAWEYLMKQGKANRVLPRECTGHSKHPLPTTSGFQDKTLQMDITRWPTLKWD